MIGNIREEIERETEHIDTISEERYKLDVQKRQQYQNYCQELADYVMQSEYYEPIVNVIKEKMEFALKRAIKGYHETRLRIPNMFDKDKLYYETYSYKTSACYQSEFECSEEIFHKILEIHKNWKCVIRYVYDKVLEKVLKENGIESNVNTIDWVDGDCINNDFKYNFEFRKYLNFKWFSMHEVYSIKLHGITKNFKLLIEQQKYLELCEKYLGTRNLKEIEELQNQANINELRSETENISINNLSNDSKD